MLIGNQKSVRIVKDQSVEVDVTVTVIGIGVDELNLENRTVTQNTCPHDAKVKMAGFKDRYECTICHKIIPYSPLEKKAVAV